jgi:hypothetical protein
MPRPPTRWLAHSHWWMHSWGSTDPEFIISPLQNPPFQACGRSALVLPFRLYDFTQQQLLRSMLNYQSLSFSLLPWRWLSLCKWDLNPFALSFFIVVPLLLSLILSSWLSYYYLRFLVVRSSQTINFIHFSACSFLIFLLAGWWSLKNFSSNSSARWPGPSLFTPMVECLRKLPNRQPSRRPHHFGPLGYWTPFEWIIFRTINGAGISTQRATSYQPILVFFFYSILLL